MLREFGIRIGVLPRGPDKALAKPEPLVEAEPVLPPSENRFSSFVASNSQKFTSYNDLADKYRETEAEWRSKFAPMLEEGVRLQESVPYVTDKALSRFKRDIHRSVFGTGASPIRFARSEVDLGNGLHISNPKIEANANEWRKDVGRFAQEYHQATAPISSDMNRVKVEVSQEIEEHLISDYRAIVDMVEFLSAPQYWAERDQIAAVFREIVKAESSRSTRESPLLTRVKLEWQARARKGVDVSILERFLIDLPASKIATNITAWMKYGAIGAQLLRDEAQGSKVEEPNLSEIEGMARLIPFGYWPSELKNAYANFVAKDAGSLVDRIRTLMQRHFPTITPGDTNGRLPTPEDYSDNDRKKRSGHSRGGAAVPPESTPSGDHPEAVERAGRFKLGIVKKFIAPLHAKDRRRWRPIDPLQVELVKEDEASMAQAIERLSGNATSPQMKRDFAELIQLLLDNPYRRGTKKMEDREFEKGMPWRSLNPDDVEGIKFEDHETRRYRVIFIIAHEYVGIKAIVHHNVYDRLTKGRARKNL